MKKDRNCGNYPVYGMVPAMAMPGAGMPIPFAAMSPMNSNTNYTSSDITTINNRLNSLEQRVNNLERMYSGNYSTSSNYNSSNYQMM